MKAIDPVTRIPMLIGGVALWFGGTILVAIAILTGALAVSKWYLLLNFKIVRRYIPFAEGGIALPDVF